jgi:hypothetical protein
MSNLRHEQSEPVFHNPPEEDTIHLADLEKDLNEMQRKLAFAISHNDVFQQEQLEEHIENIIYEITEIKKEHGLDENSLDPGLADEAEENTKKQLYH